MAKSSSSFKKPGDPKCRACGGMLEGRATAIIGGSKWHLECAQKQGKFIPVEYRDGYVKKVQPDVAPAAEASAEAEEAVAAEA